VDAGALLNQVQNAGDVVPPGRVRHVVTTYSVSPEVGPHRAATLGQWVGNAGGRLVTRQTGWLGETTVVDAAGVRWVQFQGGNEVVKVPGGAGVPPIQTPNRAALSGIGGGSQPHVVGRTTVNGRAATIMELTRTVAPLPPAPDRPAGSPGLGIAIQPTGATDSNEAPPRDVFGFFAEESGAVVRIAPSGGTVVSQLVVDDETHQIVQGRAVSRDQDNREVGTTDWRVTTDELLDAARVQPDLFTFTAPSGAPVREVAPGAPVTFNMRVDR